MHSLFILLMIKEKYICERKINNFKIASNYKFQQQRKINQITLTPAFSSLRRNHKIRRKKASVKKSLFTKLNTYTKLMRRILLLCIVKMIVIKLTLQVDQSIESSIEEMKFGIAEAFNEGCLNLEISEMDPCYSLMISKQMKTRMEGNVSCRDSASICNL